MKDCLRVVGLWVLLLAVGCGEKSKTGSEANTENGPSSHTEVVEEDLGGPLEGEPTVEVWDKEQLLEAVHSHSGKVVVVHVWASWNESLDDPANQGSEGSRESQVELMKLYGFDEFVRLKKLHRDDVAAISFNTDYNYDNQEQPPEMLKDNVLTFAKKHGANFEHGVSSVLEEPIQEDLEIIGTPATLVFDKKGELRQKFFHDEKPYSYRKDVIPLVEELVKEKAPVPEAPKPADPKPEKAASEDGVSLQILDWEGLQRLVADAKGRVAVVDLWSTQCGPCMKEFPHLVDLHNSKKNDVACFSFNLDYIGKGKPEDVQAAPFDFLKNQKATLTNILSSEKDEVIYDQLQLDSIPAVFVYDRQGKLRKRFIGEEREFTYQEDILPLVETLISEN